MHYAIIESGGKQYRIQEGDEVDVELLPFKKGDSVTFDQVLLVKKDQEIKLGQPYLSGACVNGEYVEEVYGPKVIAFKYKRRKLSRRKVGHRQRYSRIKITKIAV